MFPEQQNVIKAQTVLRVIAWELYEKNITSQHPDLLVADPLQLQKLVKGSRLDWNSMAQKLNMPRNRLYHWYWETHSRQIGTERITREEKTRMKTDIIQSLSTGSKLDLNYQANLRARVLGDKQISKTEFSIVFNNIKRSVDVQRVMEEQQAGLQAEKKVSHQMADAKPKLVPIDFNTEVANVFNDFDAQLSLFDDAYLQSGTGKPLESQPLKRQSSLGPECYLKGGMSW